MSVPLALFDSSGYLRIQVEGGGSVSEYSTDLVRALQSIASAITTGFNKLDEKDRPQQVEIACGLRALSEGGFAVTEGAEKANFRVLIKWGKPDDGGLPSAGVMPVEAPNQGP